MPEVLHVLFSLVEKHSPVSFLAEMLLFRFVAFIVHLRYFDFIVLRGKVQNQPKKYKGMFSYLVEKHMQKFRHF